MIRTVAAKMSLESVVEKLQALGTFMTRYGLVVIFAWIGAMKFTVYEANGIQPFVANSPLMSWLYSIFSVQGVSNVIGVLEVTIAAMIAVRPISAQISAAGSMLATVLFLGTLSFILSTPGVWEVSAGGFPALSAFPGQFLFEGSGTVGSINLDPR